MTIRPGFVPAIHVFAASKKQDVDARDKRTAVWHVPCLSWSLPHGDVSTNIVARLRRGRCMWCEVKSGLLWLGGRRTLEKFSGRGPMQQVGSDEGGEGEGRGHDGVRVGSQPQAQEGDERVRERAATRLC